MMRLRTSTSVERLSAPAARTLALTSRTWIAAAGVGRAGVAWSYRCPVRVEVSSPHGDARAGVTDHVMAVRVAAALLLLAVMLTRRMWK